MSTTEVSKSTAATPPMPMKQPSSASETSSEPLPELTNDKTTTSIDDSQESVPARHARKRKIMRTIFEPWSDKPAWFHASRPPVLSVRIILWVFYGLLQLYRLRWIPVPRHWGSTRRRTKENYAFIYKHESESMGIFAAISAKGGALKTSVITWMAATFGFHTNGATIVFDADTGALESAAKRLDAHEPMQGDTQRLNAMNAAELLLYGDWQPDFEEILNFVPRSEESGVYVMSMNGITQWSDRSTRKILRGHKRPCGSLFVDTGPGEKESNTRGVVAEATVVIVTGIHQNVSTDDAVLVTLNAPKYNLRNRGKDVLVAIGSVRWRHFNKRTQYELAEQFGVTPEQIVLLPHHKRILRGDTVQLKKISKKFLYAMSELNRIRVEAAIRYNRLHPMAFPTKQRPLTLEEKKKDAADTLLSLSGGDPARACEFIFGYSQSV